MIVATIEEGSFFQVVVQINTIPNSHQLIFHEKVLETK